MEIPQQVGSADCGAFAIVIATALVSGSDSTEIIFHQSEMRQHLAECFERKMMSAFPVKRKKRVHNKVLERVTIFLCPVCPKAR